MRVARDQRMGAGARGASGSRGKMGRSVVGVSSGVDSDTWAAFRAAEVGCEAIVSLDELRVNGLGGLLAGAVLNSTTMIGGLS
jgi:hypothetical protein